MLPVRDQNPLIRGAYLPLPAASAAPEGFSYTAGLEWSNTVSLERTAQERLLIDEETAELDLTAAWSSARWRLQATLPVISRGGGVLDGFIDDWHRWLGLSNGARPLRPRNAYAIAYQHAGGPLRSTPAGTALGDLALEGGRQLLDGERLGLTAWLGLEAPTGDRARLSGDGALDVATWLSGEYALGRRWQLSARAGLSHPGGDTALPLAHTLRFGTLALAWRASAALEAIGQLDAHSPVARSSSLEFLGRAVTLTIGGRYRRASGSVVEAGVVEDVEVGHSPDVTLHFGWRFAPVR